ncbi:MAG TPA: hypothetical protein V6C76_11785 [Drouetiella sp.]
MSLSESFHAMLHGAQSQIHDVKLIKSAFVSSYDEEKPAVKVIIPQDRDADDDSKAAETDWIPLMSFAVGDKIGFQWAPKGGATPENPEDGEQVCILILQRNEGVFVCPLFMFNESMTPPGAGLDDSDNDQDPNDLKGWDDDPQGLKKLKADEMVFRFASGTFVKVYENGDTQIYTAGDCYAYTKGDANVVVREGDANISVEKGDVNLDILEGDLNATVEAGDTNIETTFGNTTISSTEGNITCVTENGDIVASTDVGAISLSAPDIQLTASGTININSGIINAGVAALQALCNEFFLEKYNNHTHEVPLGGTTSEPLEPAVVGVDTTVNFEAS